MQSTLWLKAARQRLAGLAKTIEDWAPSSLYGAALLPNNKHAQTGKRRTRTRPCVILRMAPLRKRFS